MGSKEFGDTHDERGEDTGATSFTSNDARQFQADFEKEKRYFFLLMAYRNWE